MAPAEDFPAMLQRTRAALQSLVAGDPDPYLALWSHADDVTVLGGFGGWVRGWDQVRQNTASAASRFAGGQLQVEPLASGASADLAYAVWIERGAVRLAGAEGPTPLVVRVTQIFRREDGAWKLIHRHGDQVVPKG